MINVLIIADDFTGALDTGVQFAARGAATRVVTDISYDFTRAKDEIQVLVMNTETRHIPAEEAYRIVFQVTRAALDAGIPYIYKKTDSVLRGNVGSELTAVMDAAGADSIPFLPAFPKLNRVTVDGVHYVEGVPVDQSVFGRDPFEPVQKSKVADIIAEQVVTPVRNHKRGVTGGRKNGIQVYDALSDEDLRNAAQELGTDGLRISAGCAGFAAVLADILSLEGVYPEVPRLSPNLFVVCGSINTVTLRQLEAAEQEGVMRIQLTPEKKLNRRWLESGQCKEEVRQWVKIVQETGCCILDVNDSEGGLVTECYAAAKGLATEQIRVMISSVLGELVKQLLENGLDATILCTGGDTLLAVMNAIGISELTPFCELEAGVVLTGFVYHHKTYYVISKSGGFGAPDLLCNLMWQLKAEKIKEEIVC